MPTPKKGPRLASSPAHERLMLANMATSLFQNGRITTTLPKAKRLRPLAERLITLAKRGDLHNRRRVMRVIRNKSVVHILFTQIAEQMEQREGGYTRIVKIAPRVGDAAPAAVIELVTEPDLRTPEEARLFMEKLRRIFVTLGISDCSMEKGSMRCDGNVSLRRRGETKLGTKTELKNLNSFKSLHDGLAYEICRQAEVLEEGGIIYQETRHWEPSRKRTVVMRVKETADDYRLFPDPDLAPFDLDDEFIDRCRGEIPELPDVKRVRFEADFGIKAADAEQIAGDPEFAEFFEAAAAGMAGKEAQTVANLLVNEMIAYLKGAGVSLAESGIAPAQVAALAKLLATDAISSNQAHEVFEAMAQTGDDPNKIVDERGMRQVSDAGALQPIVDEVLANCADQAQQYRDGNQKVIGFLVGQCMKASRGKGNPKLFNELLRTSLS